MFKGYILDDVNGRWVVRFRKADQTLTEDYDLDTLPAFADTEGLTNKDKNLIQTALVELQHRNGTLKPGLDF